MLTVFTYKKIKIMVLWDVTLHSLEQGYQYFNTLVCTTKFTHSLPWQPLSHLHKGVSDIMSDCVQVYLPHSMAGGRNKNKQQGENTQDRKSELSLSAYCTLHPHICKTKSKLSLPAYCTLCPHICKTKSLSIQQNCEIIKSDLLCQLKVKWSLYMLIL